jgi:transcriptional regulator with XRE-family HTH domain
MVETGKRITKARERAGLSVRDLQTALGFEAPNAIYKWQRGECLPRLDHLVIIAVMLEVPIDELVAYCKTQAPRI